MPPAGIISNSAFYGVRRGYHHSLRGGIYERQMLSPSRLMKLISIVGFVVVTYNLYCFLHSKQHSGALKVRAITHNLRPQTASRRSIDDLDLAKFYATSLEVLTTLADMRHSSTSDNLLPNATTHNSVITDAAGENQQAVHLWSAQLLSKLHKLHTLPKLGGIFLYHMRKAAGTTIRDMLTEASVKWGVPFYESEGPTLNRLFLEENLLLVTSLRNPIERIFSLYWYEHVSWYDGVLHETHKCKTLNAWIEGWRDGSKWKTDFMLQNPGSVYVEVENYYVKALSGWVGPAPVGEKDFEAAILALKRFDVVFITEWINREDQILAMNSLFSIPVDKMHLKSTDHFQGKRSSQTLGHQVKGDRSARLRLGPTLADDQLGSESILKSINKYDMRLWDYALSSLALRVPLIPSIVRTALEDFPVPRPVMSAESISSSDSTVKSKVPPSLNPLLQKYIGIFRPPGHKGPF